MTNDERAERLDRIRAERAAVSRAPTIQSESVYRILAACLDANAKEHPTVRTS